MDEPEYLNAVDNILKAAKANRDLPVLTFAQGEFERPTHFLPIL